MVSLAKGEGDRCCSGDCRRR